MSAEKVSISLDQELLNTIRSAATDDGTTVSSWLADAAETKARNRYLREALDAADAEFGTITDDEADELITAMRARSIVTRPKSRTA